MLAGLSGKRSLTAYRYRHGRLFFSDDGKRPEAAGQPSALSPQPEYPKTHMFEVTPEILATARSELTAGRPSVALRAIARRFQLERTDVAWVAVDIFQDIATPEVQAIWHWDMAGDGKGHTGEEIDSLLDHLVVK